MAGRGPGRGRGRGRGRGGMVIPVPTDDDGNAVVPVVTAAPPAYPDMPDTVLPKPIRGPFEAAPVCTPSAL